MLTELGAVGVQVKQASLYCSPVCMLNHPGMFITQAQFVQKRAGTC